MAQASSAQREPSMEEILASIRRIIEDSDPAQASAADALSDNDDADTDNLTENEDIESFRAELNANPAQDQGTVEPLRLAEVQTRLREEQTAAASLDDEMESAVSTPIEEQGPARPLEWPVNDWRGGTETKPEADMAKPAPLAATESQALNTGEAERRPAIISDFAERQVAAAFEELNDAFEASRRQSLADMAEEMLRPMLQDWLDNNLPTMVERLVREEIERVARGAR